MGLFSFFNQDIAMDLGTANTIIIHNDKIVVDEPSIIAIDQQGKLIATGEKARRMHGKTHEGIKTIRPLEDGVIADFNAAEMMIKSMIRRTIKKGMFAPPSLKMVICIPSGSTNVEIRAVRDSAEHAGGRDIYIIYEPMAAALGIGLDVEAPEGCMIVDIGGGTSEIAVISLGGIVCNESINIAGDVFTEDIMTYMKQHHNIKVGERTAEDIKINVGAAIEDLEDPPEPYTVIGHNIIGSMPTRVNVTHKEIAYALDRSLAKLDAAIMKILEKTPPELYCDIVRNGIYLAGGGALLRGLAQRLSNKTKLNFHVAEDPLRAVAIGSGIALKNIDKFSFLMR